MSSRDRTSIAHVSTAHPATDNRILQKECVSLAANGLNVTLVAVAPRDFTFGDVKIAAIPRRGRRLQRMIIGPVDAWRRLDRIKPDLIHVHDPELIPMAILWKWVNRKPAIFDAHEDLPKQMSGKQYLPVLLRPILAWCARAIELLADRCLDAVVAATPAIARNFRNDRVTIVQNFPWLSSFGPPTEVNADQRTIVYIGGISEGRGLPQMLSATQNIAETELLLAGPIAETTYNQFLVPMPKHVNYAGLVAADSIPEILAASRLGLAVLHPLPNYLESQSTKIYEYMAAGRPFVASNFPYWMRQLSQFDCGIFVDPMDSEAIQCAITTLLNDPALAQEMGSRGRSALEINFTFEQEASHLQSLTFDLLEGHT